MEVKFQDRSMKPWVSPRPDPVVGTQGGLKVERGRLSLAPLGSEGRDEPPNGSNASIVVKKYRRFVAYRTTNFDVVVRLVAELLYRIAMSSRGNVYYLNGRRVALLLGLDAPFHPVDLSVIYSLMVELGFEAVEAGRGKAVIINMRYPLIKKIKAAKSVDEVVEIVKRHLGE
jgi:hypothetical protein